MKTLTTNEVQTVSGGRFVIGEKWTFGPVSWAGGTFVGLATGNPAAAAIAGGVLSIYDNIDWDAYSDLVRDDIMEKYKRGDDISDM
jgi:hypothetical protein